MHLSSFLRTDLTLLGQSFSDETEMIRHIVPLMIKDLKIDKTAIEVEELFFAREAQSQTVYPAGIGIPHVRLDNIGDPIIAIIVPKEPLTVYKIPVKMFTVIITDTSASKLYLNIVKALMSIAKKKEFFDELCQIEQPRTFINRIREEEIHILNDITVGDVMISRFITVQETAYLKELGNLIEENHSQYFPVLNQNNQMVGEVTLIDYLKVGIPKYALLMENMKFPKTLEPLEDIFKKECTLTVKDIMSPIKFKLTASSSISEAVFIMVQHQRRYLPVFQDNQLVGILFASDIFKKVIRG